MAEIKHLDYGRGGDKLSFRQIIFEHLKETLKKARTEFRGGYYEKKHLPSGLVVDTYVPDSRQEYIQSVEALHDLLLPKFDPEMKEVSKDYEQEVEELFTTMKQSELTNEQKIQRFQQDKLPTTRILFQELNKLLDRLDYLQDDGNLEE